MVKERIDIMLAKKGLAPSREKAKALVMAGEVYIGNERVHKPDIKVPFDVEIEIKKDSIPYVGYGGVKLAHAVNAFNVDLCDKVIIDIGSSTGGFVDFMLKSGALYIYAIDTGTHQLHESLRKDKRVILKEHFNARYLVFEDVGEKVDLVTIDVSFISLKKILPATIPLLKPGGHIISLVKPQFEVGRFEVGRGGIVKDKGKIEGVLEDIKSFGKTLGLKYMDFVESPREKTKKNREYFMLWGL
ncbi:MAG: TlyA family RNA methyltransferase [Pseudomonadota bacterium]|nr:TlyA family RNA methyltransferase [Pseudomonadota bacterium]